MLDQLISTLDERRTEALLLVGIDGMGGSGKSTVARSISRERPGTALVEIDDFYRPMDPAERTVLEPSEGYAQFVDWSRLLDQVLVPLARGQIARYQAYDWGGGERLRSDWITVEPSGTIVVEGVGALRPELRGSYGFKVFVDTPPETCINRVRDRGHNSEEMIQKWAAAETWYIQNHRPDLAADLIIPGH